MRYEDLMFIGGRFFFVLLWIRANVSLIRIHVTGRGHLAGKSPGPFYTKLKSRDRKTTNVWLKKGFKGHMAL